jgi:hypothetical protein
MAGRRHAGDIALDVREEDRDALRGEPFGDQLERLGPAGAGGACHQPVPVEHAQRGADRRAGAAVALPERRAEVERRAAEGVTGGDRGGDRGQPRGRPGAP